VVFSTQRACAFNSSLADYRTRLHALRPVGQAEE
jgi:hypothetical protein